MAAAVRPRRPGFSIHPRTAALFAVFFVASAALSEGIRPGQEAYTRAALAKDEGDIYQRTGASGWLANSSFQTLAPTLLGIKEVVASLMWVQADDYFHRGEYKPILRMIKQITAIDPHQLDVYATGAWHMAYNFMDKRLIANGIEFLEEGCRNNDNVYDLYFELGYMHYDKTKNYPEAIRAYHASTERGTTAGVKVPPSYTRHQLAHAMEKSGDIDAAIRQWTSNVELALNLIKGGERSLGASGPNLEPARHNWYITIRRKNEREAVLAEAAGDRARALALWEANAAMQRDWLKRIPSDTAVQGDLKTVEANIARVKSGKLKQIQPSDLTLSYTVTRTAPRFLVIEGTVKALNLSKIRVQIADKDYDKRAAQGIEWKMENCTMEWDNATVKGGRFRQELKLERDPADMGRDPASIYPLKAEELELSLTINPRLQPAFIQDVYGWNGELLTARNNQVVIDPRRPGKIDGKAVPLRMVVSTVILKSAELTGKGKKVLAVVR